MVKTNDVSKDYFVGKEVVHALKNANIVCNNGSVTLFMGPSGSGKTTALKVIGGMITATSGEIVVDEYTLNTLSEKELCSFRFNEIGMVFQDFLILDHLSVWDNILLSFRVGNKKDRKNEKEYYPKAEEIMNELGIWELKKRKASDLSGGQRQRVAVARALLKDPKVLLADEPTANLDSKTAISVIELFKDITEKNGIVTIIATHDERLTTYSDKVYDFVDGEVKERKV